MAYAQTLAGMKQRISDEIIRPDLYARASDPIGNAIADAIAVYQKQRFRFSDITPNAPPTFNTVAARYIYTSADNANISTLYNFDYVLVTIGNEVTPLDRWTPAELKNFILVNTMQGQPFAYAYEGNQLLLAPVPNDAWTITLGIFRNVLAPATDNEADNPWMVAAERLIRARAKYELAVHVLRNAAMAASMSPDPPIENGGQMGQAWREFKALKGETNRVTGTGRIRPMAF